jgi:hypothetical protein
MKSPGVVNYDGFGVHLLPSPHTSSLLENCSMSRFHMALSSFRSCLATVRDGLI